MSLARPDVDSALRRLCVDLEHPAELDEWRRDRSLPRSFGVHKSPHSGAISVKDKHGNDIIRRAA